MKDNIDVAMAISDYQQSKIHSIDEAMKIKLQQQSVVLVLGASQTGKSTFQNFLAVKDLECDGEGKIRLKPGAVGLLIGTGIESCTKAPQPFEIQGKIYIDCPGFDDTSAQDDLINSAQIKHITSMCANVKILLMSNSSTFMGLITQQKTLYKHFFNFIGKQFDFSKLKDSVGLIVTKVQKDNLKKLQEKMKAKIQDLEFDQHEQQLIMHLIQNAQYFYAAKQDDINNTDQDRTEHLKYINQLRPLSIQQKDFNPVISEAAQKVLSEQMLLKREEALKYLKEGSQSIKSQNNQDIQNKGTQLTRITNLLSKFTKQTYYPYDIHEITQSIQTWSTQYGYPVTKLDQLHTLSSVFKFFNHFNYCIKQLSDQINLKVVFLDELSSFKVQLEQEILKLQKMAEDERIRQHQIQQQLLYQQQLLLQQQRQREYEVQQKILAEELARQKALAQKQALAEAQKYQEALRIQELNRQEQIRQQELIRIQREQAEAERIRKEKELYDNAQKLKAQEEALKEEKRKQQEILIKKQQEYEAQQAKDKAQKEKFLKELEYQKKLDLYVPLAARQQFLSMPEVLRDAVLSGKSKFIFK